MHDNIFNFYSDLAVTENNNLPENGVLDISQEDDAYANLCSVIDTLKHNLYQDAEFNNIVNAISECGLDRSLLFMYNRNNELSRMTNIHIPSLEEFDNGYRLSNNETDLLLCDMIKHVYFAGQESLSISEVFEAIGADFVKPAMAGIRWFQTIIDKPKKLSDKIEHAIDTIKSSKITKFSDRSISMPSLENIKKILDHDNNLIEEANKLLLDVCNGKIKEDDVIDAGNRMKKIDTLSNSYADTTHRLTNRSTQVKLSSISPNELIKLGEKAIKKLDSIEKMNKTYPGFFHMGSSVGKLQGIISELIPKGLSAAQCATLIAEATGQISKFAARAALKSIGNVSFITFVIRSIGAVINRGYLTTSVYGWRALTVSVSADMRVCNLIAKILNEAEEDCAK